MTFEEILKQKQQPEEDLYPPAGNNANIFPSPTPKDPMADLVAQYKAQKQAALSNPLMAGGPAVSPEEIERSAREDAQRDLAFKKNEEERVGKQAALKDRMYNELLASKGLQPIPEKPQEAPVQPPAPPVQQAVQQPAAEEPVDSTQPASEDDRLKQINVVRVRQGLAPLDRIPDSVQPDTTSVPMEPGPVQKLQGALFQPHSPHQKALDYVEQIRQAQAQAHQNRNAAQMQLGAEQIASAIGRTPLDNTMSNLLQKNAAIPVEELTQQQGAKEEDVKYKKLLQEATSEEAQRNPNGAMSSIVKEGLTKLGYKVPDSFTMYDYIKAGGKLDDVFKFNEMLEANKNKTDELRLKHQDALNTKNAADITKNNKEIQEATAPSFRNAVVRKNTELLNRMGRADEIISDLKDGKRVLKDLTPQEKSQMVIALAVAETGGQPTLETIHSIDQEGIGPYIARKAQAITGNSYSTGQQGYLQRVYENFKKDKHVIERQILDQQLKNASGSPYANAKNIGNENGYYDTLSAQTGIDPEALKTYHTLKPNQRNEAVDALLEKDYERLQNISQGKKPQTASTGGGVQKPAQVPQAEWDMLDDAHKMALSSHLVNNNGRP